MAKVKDVSGEPGAVVVSQLDQAVARVIRAELELADAKADLRFERKRSRKAAERADRDEYWR